jgi:type IV pilus assembly protein PilE
MTVLAVAALLAMFALPSYREHALRGGRMDAVAALARVQAAQEQHRTLHGRYAADVAALAPLAPGGGSALSSPQGRYTITLTAQGPDAYMATATAQGSQADDRACAALTLEVVTGFAHEGPTPGCWQR